MSAPKPIFLLIVSFFIWFVAYLSIPATYIKLGDAIVFSVIILMLYNIAFILGTVGVKTANKGKSDFTKRKKRQLVFILFTIGFFGVLIKIYQRFFIQKIYFAEDLVRTRIDLMSSELSSGFLGVISALSYPFATICFLLCILWYKELKLREFIVIVLMGLFPIYDALLTESRLIIVVIIIMLIFTLLNSNLFKKIVIIKLHKIILFKVPNVFFKRKTLIVLGILSIVFISFSVKVMNNRLSTFAYRDTLRVWEIYHETKIDDDFKEEVTSSKALDKNKLIGLYSLKHYLAHSVFEYTRLLNHLEYTTGYYYGGFQLYVYFKVLKALKINIPSFSQMSKITYKEAVYTTFWGPFYIDFGIFGILISFFLGRFSKQKYLNAKNGSEGDILMYSFVGVVILASFFVNFLMGANIYFLNAILITIFLFKYWPNKLIFSNKE